MYVHSVAHNYLLSHLDYMKMSSLDLPLIENTRNCTVIVVQ